MDNPSSSSARTASVSNRQHQQQVPDVQSGTTIAKSSSTTTTSKYVRDFESLFVPINVDRLRNNARNGNLRHSQFRSLCWRYFLHCLPERYEDWLNACKESRKKYDEIRARHLGSIKPRAIKSDKIYQGQQKSAQYDPKPPKGSGVETRDEEQEYIKASNECDHKNIYNTIERDVVRTFPDMEFFRQTEMQEILGNILFNFASENPHLSYKQGMHELLATLLYVAHTDSQNCLINYEGDYANEAIATLLDLKYLEHDVFHLFSALLKSIESWYQNDEILMIPESTTNHRLTSPKQQVGSVLGLKLKKISENIVRKYDIELFNHLEALQIAPQIYGIRWMRLLFGREYEFLDLLTVWDAIICDQDSMSLVDYVFASMLMTIREELINGDYTDCLNNLMRHQFVDVPYVIRLALHLRDPINNARPKAHRNYNQHRIRQQPPRQQPPRQQPPRQQPPNQQPLRPYQSSSQASRYNTQTQSFYHHSHPSNFILSPEHRVKEYEMKEMHSIVGGQSSSLPSTGKSKITLGQLSTTSGSLDVSNESYEDLHSIVDYCWRLLSEQIDSLQRCLPKEKSLSSEDEIFVALAQLKKVRDVLKGSLRLEDELETNPAASVARPLSKNINL